MKVAELIEKLKKHDPDMTVYVFDKNWGPSEVRNLDIEIIRTTFSSWNPDDEKQGLVIR